MADAPKAPGGEGGKGGASQLLLKKGGAEDDGADAKPKKVLKPAPTSGRSLGRAIIVAALLITVAWVFASATQQRYQLVPVPSQDNTFMYRLDQRSGAVHFCSTQQCVELPVKSQ